MNQLNYASLEACKRLVDAGIVLETDFVWRLGADGRWMSLKQKNQRPDKQGPCPKATE